MVDGRLSVDALKRVVAALSYELAPTLHLRMAVLVAKARLPKCATRRLVQV